MDNDSKEIKFDDESSYEDDTPPEYSSKSDFSKGSVVQEALKRCIVLRSDEMRPGYYNYTVSDNTRKEIWVTDTRDKFISSVIALRNLLGPEINRDEKFKGAIEPLEEECETLFDKYAYSPYESEVQSNGQIIFKKNEEIKYMPMIESIVSVSIYDQNQKRKVMREVKGGWDNYVNGYKESLLNIYDKIFRELNVLIDSINYFKKKSGF